MRSTSWPSPSGTNWQSCCRTAIRSLALLEAEHANLRAALAWLEDTDERGALLRLAAPWAAWTGRGYSQSRDWLERALAHDGAAAADRAKALVALGVIQIYQGANQEAETRLIEGWPAAGRWATRSTRSLR